MTYSTLIIDFSRVLLFSHAEVESLNAHHQYLSQHFENYQVLDHFYLNEDLLALLDEVKPSANVYLFSDSSLHGLPDIRSRISSTFREIIAADESGYKKSDTKAYEWLLKRLNAQPDKTIFLDDRAANVDAAATAGIHAIQFLDNEQTLPMLRTLLGVKGGE